MSVVYAACFPEGNIPYETVSGTTIYNFSENDGAVEEMRSVLKAIALMCNMEDGYSYADLLRKVARAKFEDE